VASAARQRKDFEWVHEDGTHERSFAVLDYRGHPKTTAAELTRVRVGVLATGEFCQTYIAQKKGFFAKNGLGVELVYFQGGSQVIQAMLGGDLPLTVTAGPRVSSPNFRAPTSRCFHPIIRPCISACS